MKLNTEWKIKDYFVQFILLAGSIYFSNLFAMVFVEYDLFGSFYQIFFSSIIFMFILLAATTYYLKLKMTPKIYIKQLNSIFCLSSIQGGLIDYLRYFPIILVISMVNYYLLRFLNMSWPRSATRRFLLLADNRLKIMLVGLLIVFVAPVVEEYFFRGSLYRLLRDKFSPRLAAIISGFIFAVVHFEPYYFPTLLLLGYLLGNMYEKDGRLARSVVFHGFHNMIVLIFFYSIY